MSFWTAAAVVTSAVVGSRAAKKAAQQTAAAQRDAAAMQAEGFNFYKPYLQDVIDSGETYLQDQLETGAYTGQTYANMNPLSAGGLNYGATQAQQLAGVPSNFMDTSGGFANNFSNLYNRAADINADGNYAGTVLNQASAYGNQSPQAQAMVDNIMRDETRRLYEGQIPQINRQASATGNANASKAAVAEAIARRGYEDRRADVSADVADKLTGRYLTQANTDFTNANAANLQLGNVYNNAYKMIPQLAQLQTAAGDRFQQNEQAVLNDARMRFEMQRDYQMDKLNEFNSGVLNQAVRNSPQNPLQVTASPSAASLGGAMAGAGFGLDMYKEFKKG